MFPHVRTDINGTSGRQGSMLHLSLNVSLKCLLGSYHKRRIQQKASVFSDTVFFELSENTTTTDACKIHIIYTRFGITDYTDVN